MLRRVRARLVRQPRGAITYCHLARSGSMMSLARGAFRPPDMETWRTRRNVTFVRQPLPFPGPHVLRMTHLHRSARAHQHHFQQFLRIRSYFRLRQRSVGCHAICDSSSRLTFRSNCVIHSHSPKRITSQPNSPRRVLSFSLINMEAAMHLLLLLKVQSGF